MFSKGTQIYLLISKIVNTLKVKIDAVYVSFDSLLY